MLDSCLRIRSAAATFLVWFVIDSGPYRLHTRIAHGNIALRTAAGRAFYIQMNADCRIYLTGIWRIRVLGHIGLIGAIQALHITTTRNETR